MSKLIIGVDPDSDKSGFAFYCDGELVRLECLDIPSIFIELESLTNQSLECELHIEDLNSISSNAFNIRSNDPLPVKLKKTEGVAKCKQAQLTIESIADHFGIEVVKHRVSSKWKSTKEKKEFQEYTGWTKNSNEDTRSAAYFGYIGVLKNKGK